MPMQSCESYAHSFLQRHCPCHGNGNRHMADFYAQLVSVINVLAEYPTRCNTDLRLATNGECTHFPMLVARLLGTAGSCCTCSKA